MAAARPLSDSKESVEDCESSVYPQLYPDEIFKDEHVKDLGSLLKYKGTWFPKLYYKDVRLVHAISNLRLQPSDVFVASFPKSGTTWVQYIVLQIISADCLNKTNEYLDDPRTLNERFPLIDESFISISQCASPRYIKTHQPYDLLPRDVHRGVGKVIYITRSPKDTLVSLYHFMRSKVAIQYTGDFENLFNEFMDGKVMFGAWLDHVKRYWENRYDDNLLFIKYEDLHRKSFKMVRYIVDFLECSVSDAQIEEIIRVASFDSMKKNPKVNSSTGRTKKRADGNKLRKGIVGDWQNYFSDEMSERMESELLDPLRACGLHFD